MCACLHFACVMYYALISDEVQSHVSLSLKTLGVHSARVELHRHRDLLHYVNFTDFSITVFH